MSRFTLSAFLFLGLNLVSPPSLDTTNSWSLLAQESAYAQVTDPNEYTRGIMEQQRIVQKFEEGRRKGKEAEKSYHMWTWLAPLIGISFWVVLFIVYRLVSGKGLSFSLHKFKEEPPPRRGVAKSIIKGKQTHEELGQAIFDALKLGAYNQFRLLFPTVMEIAKYLPPEKVEPYRQNILSDLHLRKVFQALKEIFPQGPCTLAQSQASPPQKMKTAPGAASDSVQGVSSFKLVVQVEASPQTLEIGSLIQFPEGWKIFVPKIKKLA